MKLKSYPLRLFFIPGKCSKPKAAKVNFDINIFWQTIPVFPLFMWSIGGGVACIMRRLVRNGKHMFESFFGIISHHDLIHAIS